MRYVPCDLPLGVADVEGTHAAQQAVDSAVRAYVRLGSAEVHRGLHAVVVRALGGTPFEDKLVVFLDLEELREGVVRLRFERQITRWRKRP